MRFYAGHAKRWLDIAAAALVLAALGVPMLAIAAAVRLDSPGPALFRQTRLGRGGRPFVMLKFRTMRVGAERTGSGVYSDDADPRVTRVGRWLRRLSLDELPQALNVLRGEMSLIGPRPPLTYHPWPLEGYSEEQRRMFEVRPGITGWAQVHGRRTVEWGERIRMNVWYVDHVSFLLDCRIALATVSKVLAASDNENVGRTV